jgi:hypothetical protein
MYSGLVVSVKLGTKIKVIGRISFDEEEYNSTTIQYYYVKSPFENRIAVILKETGDSNIYNVLGCHLDVGFE